MPDREGSDDPRQLSAVAQRAHRRVQSALESRAGDGAWRGSGEMGGEQPPPAVTRSRDPAERCAGHEVPTLADGEARPRPARARRALCPDAARATDAG